MLKKSFCVDFFFTSGELINCELRTNRSALAIIGSKLIKSCERRNCQLRTRELRTKELRVANGGVSNQRIANVELRMGNCEQGNCLSAVADELRTINC
jgi:hypothetical protein